MWVPGALFAVLGCFFLQKAIRRGARQSWSWGRGGGVVPVSRWGYASWGVTFLSVAVVVTYGSRPPTASIVVLLVAFLAMLAIGFLDSYRYSRGRRTPDSDRAPRD